MYIENNRANLAPSPALGAALAGDLTANFNASEFYSRKRRGGAKIVPIPRQYHGNLSTLARNLQILRERARKPVRVNSGYRTPEYNQLVGGKPGSRHLTASAADITVDGQSPRAVFCLIAALIQQGQMAEGGLGLYKTHVHYDVRGQRARWAQQGLTIPDCRAPAQKSLSSTQISRAIRQNRYFGRQLKWKADNARILSFLGLSPTLQDERAFVVAIARWQASQPGLRVDGVLGRNTWPRLQRAIELTKGGGKSGAASTKEPLCKPAQFEINILQDLLKELYEEIDKAAPDQAKAREIRGRILGAIQRIMDFLDSYITEGCCEPHLKSLENQVKGLPWRNNPPKKILVELEEAIRAAVEKARRDYKHC